MKTKIYFRPDEPPASGGGQENKPAPGGKPEGGETPPQSFEGWLDGQTDEVKALYKTHTEKLTNTVKAVRDERDDLQKQLKAAGKTLEEGSAAKKALDDISGKLDEANRRADFFQAATRPDVGCTSPELAWLAVQSGGSEFVDGRGNVKFDLLKERHPALFAGKPPAPKGNAGAGTDTPPAGKPSSVDDMIRTKAGINTRS